MTYLTPDQYIAYGGQLSAIAFTPLELKSRKRIDKLTDCRVQPMAEAGNVPEAVQLCMMALIDMESKAGIAAQATTPSPTSFSTDGYTESYGNMPDAAAADAQMDRLVKEYLYGEKDDHGVPLLYRGVR
jgi:hypothetical protein